eukprot:12698395-Ditylum_brightwellii.AAC.1
MKDKVNHIAEELQNLLLEQQRIARRALRLQRRLIKINGEGEDAVSEQLNKPEPPVQQQREAAVCDRGRNVVQQGNTIVFLTSGAYLSHGDLAIDANCLWVTARDNQGLQICQAPNNVRVMMP